MSKYISLRNRSATASIFLDKKTIVVLFGLGCLLLMLFLVGLSIGSTMIPPVEVIKQVLGIGNGKFTFIIDSIRLPRMLLALLVGAALGVSGLILQSMIRNPLGSPDIVGITGGASFAAVIFITYFAGSISMKWLPAAAIAGAGIMSMLVYTLAWKKGVTPIRLVLVGIGMAAAMGAMTTLLLVLGSTVTTSHAYLWLTGSVYGASWAKVYAMLPWVLIFVPLTLLFSRTANAQEMGDQVATSLGVRVQMHRFGLLFVSVALAGSAVAFAGGIGFVGLIAPHIARQLVGRAMGGLVLVSALIGGMIVCAADIVARTAFIPLDIPAGVFVSGIGAPFFIYLLYRNRHQ
ncbi:FecCD family ABC transporter permease [Paenibacillus sp. 481]|uniref:FecCD family ABC transporter permease n=1 Tax=Paenibacillus sp. 481 TaxID=2835869 RepID=UPI001E449C51|nr:iron ABC transporter permease [Paenibacillus sp. 481]UHA73404.1 iron ABC transporter permease [Paenibacillus sp. 481]